MWTPKQFYNLYLSSQKKLIREIALISGMVPKEFFLYRLALTHSSFLKSSDKKKDRDRAIAQGCNERLEFLGDS
ncbi:MAG: hypothetical protein AAF804_21315, partial [Bacteroidota bacterium]